MKKYLILMLLFLVLPLACNKNEMNADTAAYGRIKVEAYDSPPPAGVEHIFLTVKEVSLHESSKGWQVVSKPNRTIDFLELINGATSLIADAPLAEGRYSQMRLELSVDNTIVVNGNTYPLTIPSGTESGVKLNLNFDVARDELVEVLVDFDAGKSLNIASNDYKLKPVFKTFKKVVSGTIAGSVKIAGDTPVANALITAVNTADPNDSVSTISDSSGEYKLVVLAGTYDVTAASELYPIADRSYAGVAVSAGGSLTGKNFILQ